MSVPTAPVVAGSLVGGYAVARFTKIRPLGGAVLAAGGFVAQRQWAKHAGPVNAADPERRVLRRVRGVAPVGEEDRGVAGRPHRRGRERSRGLGTLRPPPRRDVIQTPRFGPRGARGFDVRCLGGSTGLPSSSLRARLGATRGGSPGIFG